MRNIRVTFSDGNKIETQINGTEAEINDYYLGWAFQFGDTESCPQDNCVKAVKVEFLED